MPIGVARAVLLGSGNELAGATLNLDFANGRYRWDGSTSLSTALLCTRADVLESFAPNSDGTWTRFLANEPRVGVGTGLWIEASTTNRLLRSRDLNNAIWMKSNTTLADSGSNPVVGSVAYTVVDVPVGSTSFAVPAGVTSIDAYAYGPGGNGTAGVANTRGGAGGGGGAFTFLTGITVTPSTTIEVAVPAGGGAAPTYLKDNGGTIVVSADYGRNAVDNTAPAGGLSANCVGGSVNLSGGTGGTGSLGVGNRGGGGGGGTGLPLVFSGLASNYSGRSGLGGGAFGGAGGSSASAPGSVVSSGATSGLGGTGGSNHLGLGAGAGGTPSVAATAGSNGGGGGGGSSGIGINGANGSAFATTLASGLTSFNISVCGAAGGGGGIAGNGGNGAIGGGGGGGGSAAASFGTGGTGGDGKLLIAYGTANAIRVTASAPGGYLAQTYTPVVPTTYTASIAGTTMTVTVLATGIIAAGYVILGTGVTADTRTVSQISGTFGGAGDYTVSISQTVAATTMNNVPFRTPSVVARPATVTGAIYLSQDGGINQTDISSQLVTGKWLQMFVPFDAVLVPEWRLTFANSGDALDIDFGQLEDKIAPTTPVATVATQVTRPTDIVTLNLAAFPAWVTSDALTILQTATPMAGNTGVAGQRMPLSSWTWLDVWGFDPTPAGTITASIASNIMTVTATSMALATYQGISGAGVTTDTYVFGQQSGTTGSTGTYFVLPVQTVGSESMSVLPQQSYKCNATIKPAPSFDQNIGCTVVNTNFALIYGFDPQTEEYVYREVNRLGFSTTASLKEGITALNGDTENSNPVHSGGNWADATKLTSVRLGDQTPGSANTLNGPIGQLVIFAGTAWTAAQLAAWTGS